MSHQEQDHPQRIADALEELVGLTASLNESAQAFVGLAASMVQLQIEAAKTNDCRDISPQAIVSAEDQIALVLAEQKERFKKLHGGTDD